MHSQHDATKSSTVNAYIADISVAIRLSEYPLMTRKSDISFTKTGPMIRNI
jgi:hypothetical protein